MPTTPTPQTNRPDEESVLTAGDVITEDIIIVNERGESYSIRNFVIEVVLFEDIFSNCMSGHMEVVEAASLITRIPIVGAESITFRYRTPTFKEIIGRTFKITSIDNRMFSSTDKEQRYRITFISTESYLDSVTNLSKKFSGSTDAVITSIFTDYLTSARFMGPEASEPSELVSTGETHTSSVAFVAASWSPLKCINWVANRAFGSGQEAPSFLFYESNKGFRFFSIEQLIDRQRTANDIFCELVYAPNNQVLTDRNNAKYKFKRPELSRQYGNVRAISPFTHFDILRAGDFGYYAANLITADPITKVYQENPYDYYNQYLKFKHLRDPAFIQVPDALVRTTKVNNIIRTKSSRLHNNMADPAYEKWMLQRNSLMFEATMFHLEVEIAGRTDIEVGKLVNFLYPKAIEKSEVNQPEDALDPYISGLYLITAIRHSFSLNTHTMYLEIMKDTYSKQI